ncbi:hypothetical protein DM02DRAFT_627253 [Periconia macrospinosa]|uniref:FHA domain-containing protein n=1 Tax=Periconia macrospinosa TaxID=97972 RepID=A0A2V1DUN5_9PLEO|nr:hypothetical protein DM02DRAFT_627253 [Periconia macrospinosa]
MDSSPNSRVSQLPMEPERQSLEPTRKPSLLPAFEPFSSSPIVPRPTSSKRKFNEDSPSYPKQQLKYYPTPVPTSSTGMLPSSPQNVRPALDRSISMLSERQPLGAVPTIDLPADGEILKMGRSSNSSDYQLSANRLISRVHVQAAYHAPSASYPHGYIEMECLGWNGAKVHCKGCVFELAKGDTYVSENPDAEIMLDVQETRVMIAWPVIPRKLSWDSDDEATPTRRVTQDHFASSPPLVPRSPVSQSPMRQPVFTTEPVVPPQSSSVKIFEDVDANGNGPATSPIPADTTFIRPAQSISRSPTKRGVLDTKSSVLSSFNDDDFSDGDEENDPVVHSFGPFGDNLLPRLASFSTATPIQRNTPSQRRPRAALASSSPRLSNPETLQFKNSPIKNHVINQLAYSRLHSQPLSVIHTNLPAELKASITKPSEDNASGSSGQTTPVPQLGKQDLKKLLDEIPCVGEIPRSGKDAAGQPLENEFYYVPEMDTDTARRETITMGMRGAGGLRAVRKQHKQYYWKKPRV